MSKNDDDIVSGKGGGWKVMIGIIISENDDNCGPPLLCRWILAVLPGF